MNTETTAPKNWNEVIQEHIIPPPRRPGYKTATVTQSAHDVEPQPYGSEDNRVAVLRAAIARAIAEIENDGADAAYETLRHAWEISR